jgi:hypothetical protein
MIRKIVKKLKYELQFSNTAYYTRISEKILKAVYQRLLRKKINSLPPIILRKEVSALTLSILANKKRFYESIAALYSFCFWNRNVDVHYHEDGTLSASEVAFLKKIFPGITVFMRNEQNTIMNKYLLSKELAGCAYFRDHFLFSIKIFDMIKEKHTPYILHIDSDVLFFSKPQKIIDIAAAGKVNGCYNADVANIYIFDDTVISRYIDKPILNRFNSGLLLHNFDEAFFYFANMVLSDYPSVGILWHWEQTLFALYASKKGGFLELPKTYSLGRAARTIGEEVISKHYVHNTGYTMHKDFIYKLYPMFIDTNRTLSTD